MAEPKMVTLPADVLSALMDAAVEFVRAMDVKTVSNMMAHGIKDTSIRVHTHPGEILHKEFMVPLGLSAFALARDLNVPLHHIVSIISPNASYAITSDIASRLGPYFGTTPDFWLNLQTAYDMTAEYQRNMDAARKAIELVRAMGTALPCPFDDPLFAMNPATPCPVCGDIGTNPDDPNSHCINLSVAIVAQKA